jgi:hypothetical protein
MQQQNSPIEIANAIQFCANRDAAMLNSLFQCLAYEKSFFGGENDIEVRQLNQSLDSLSMKLADIKQFVQAHSTVCDDQVQNFLTDFTCTRQYVQQSLFLWQQTQSYPDDKLKVAKLDIIEVWYTRIYNLLIELKVLLLKYIRMDDQKIIKIDAMLSELCIQSLIFEEQPKQVIIKGSKYATCSP